MTTLYISSLRHSLVGWVKRDPEFRAINDFWITAFAGMTFVNVLLSIETECLSEGVKTEWYIN